MLNKLNKTRLDDSKVEVTNGEATIEGEEETQPEIEDGEIEVFVSLCKTSFAA